MNLSSSLSSANRFCAEKSSAPKSYEYVTSTQGLNIFPAAGTKCAVYFFSELLARVLSQAVKTSCHQI